MILQLLFVIFSGEILAEASNIGGKLTGTGFSDIVRLREFIDKSLLVKHILQGPEHIVIQGPTGFGKSTNLLMLKEFLELEVDSNGTAICPKKILKNYETFVINTAKNSTAYPRVNRNPQNFGILVNDTNKDSKPKVGRKDRTSSLVTNTGGSSATGTKTGDNYGNVMKTGDISASVSKTDNISASVTKTGDHPAKVTKTDNVSASVTKTSDTSATITKTVGTSAPVTKADDTSAAVTKTASTSVSVTKSNGTTTTVTKTPISVNVTTTTSPPVTSMYDVFENPLTNYKTFANLKILLEAPDIFQAHFAQYPVFHIDFSSLPVKTFDGFVKSWRKLVSELFTQFNYLLESKRLSKMAKDDFYLFRDHGKELSIEEVALAGEKLALLLHGHHQLKVIALVDDLDAPVRKGLLSPGIDDKEFARIVHNVVRFISKLVKNNVNVARTVVTQVLRVGEPLVNQTHYSIFEDNYLHGFYGLNEEDITELVKRFRPKHKIESIRNWYGGYITRNVSPKLYNTLSTISYLKSGELKPYLVQSHLNHTGLKNLFTYEKTGRLLEESFDRLVQVPDRKDPLSDVTDLRLMVHNPGHPVDQEVILQFLLDNGLYTVDKSAILRVPNREADLDLKNLIFSREFYKTKLGLNDTTITAYIASINKMTSEEVSYRIFYDRLTQVFENCVPKTSRELHRALYYLAIRRFPEAVRSEDDPNATRQDLLVKRYDETGIVIAVSSDPPSDDALKNVFLRCFEVFKECSTKIGILIGLYVHELGKVSISVSYMFDNRTLAEGSNYSLPEAHNLSPGN